MSERLTTFAILYNDPIQPMKIEKIQENFFFWNKLMNQFKNDRHVDMISPIFGTFNTVFNEIK